MLLVERYESKYTRYCFFAAFLIHFLHKNVHTHLHTRISDRFHAPDKLNNGPCGNSMREVNAVG